MELDFSLFAKEGWKAKKHKGAIVISTPYDDLFGPYRPKHPALIHLDIYKRHEDAGTRFTHLKKAHDYFWPNVVWHEWRERRFMAHCENHNYITLAAGASASKSFDVADLAILFWYAAPKERNVTIASVTLASLMGRVWGYLTAHIKEMALPLPYKYYREKPPKILYEYENAGKNKVNDDTLHGIFAVTARVGDDDQAVATWIGKHPKDKMLVVLDECTDMPMSITNATPNLNSHPEKFQLIGIGNSSSTFDLHGILSTPAGGWGSVSTELQSWATTQQNGICLYFNPYESPAITHPDPEMRKILGRFLIREDTLKAKEAELGTDSDKFYRWVLGFWKSRNYDETVLSEAILTDTDFYEEGAPEWSGFYPLEKIAGLDPSFSTGGDKCIIKIGTVGHSIDNTVKIDFGGHLTTYEISLKAITTMSLEKQVALETVRILGINRVPITHLAIDATGQGRALGEVICLVNEQQGFPLGQGVPLKVYSMASVTNKRKRDSYPDILPQSSYGLWMELRELVDKKHIFRLDHIIRSQLTTRLIVVKERQGAQTRVLESKMEYKRRMSALGIPHSPDQADAAALAIQVAKHRLGIVPGTAWQPRQKQQDTRTFDTLLAYENERREVKKPMVLEADFSGSLSSYVNNMKPF